ncbi:MAG: oxidoreductase [Bacteroidetes bacterium GWF2_42_66]|nr:MAG: oxidoreductase [Bacteroidetes bacterium GWA2_42_15]OFX97668.1 MAG: oxidoreductase [Bacteroidetes bacterium GWE2_42_39]OFY46916.1 MAG: oxidoreductase [Bacteroidetes bacterium GWF2_42_66]HBL75724.1 oxidoreductase [Prolixibacteraceae bacterium]HCU59565.1 oxidoreductase [Prolixibacteraceae bacterium]
MNENSKKNGVSRRAFLGTTVTAAAGITIIPSFAMGKSLGHMAPSDKLNIVGVGIGGMGFANLKNLESQNIIGLCDVDWKYSQRVFDYFPKAKKYKDWRVMYDELGKEVDGVVVATADHTHAIIAATAITMGKHVYVQKPLTHSVYESRLLTKLADKYKVATQMGNQGSSKEGVNLTCEWLANGEIGDVVKVEAFTDRPIWPQGLNTPENGDWVPETLDWNLFVGPAQMRPYNKIYHPWNWRGWWDYGTGALGDMACHILHPVFVGLELGYPTKAQGNSTLLLQDCAPSAQSVKLTFPARTPKKKMKMKLPEVEVYWYDGGIKPMLPDGWPAGKNPNDSGGGVIFHGTKDKLICGCYGVNPWLLSGRVPEAPKYRRRIDVSHELDWVRACKESPESRVKTASDFSEAGPFNEMVVMGVLAVRLQSLNKELEWNGEKMEFTNIKDDEQIKTVIKDGFKIHDGHPTFEKTWTDPVPATQFAAELIKHTYRAPWKLPDMPA